MKCKRSTTIASERSVNATFLTGMLAGIDSDASASGTLTLGAPVVSDMLFRASTSGARPARAVIATRCDGTSSVTSGTAPANVDAQPFRYREVTSREWPSGPRSSGSQNVARGISLAA